MRFIDIDKQGHFWAGWAICLTSALVFGSILFGVAVSVLIYKFAVAGLQIWGMTFPNMTAGEFGAAFALILAAWLGREWTEKKVEK